MTNAAQKYRGSIVEHDTPTRCILRDVIAGAPRLKRVSQPASRESAQESLPAARPDVVRRDISVPWLNGVECVRRLRPLLPQTQFLMLTVREDADHIFAAPAAGAAGHLLERTRRVELLRPARRSCRAARR